VVLLGGIDTGKTTFGLSLAEHGRSLGRSAAFVDADMTQPTVGPPSCIGLRYYHDPVAETGGSDDGPKERPTDADGLWFVGSTYPEGNLLSLATGTTRLVRRARDAGCDLIVVDLVGLVSGIAAQTLHHCTFELVRPDAVVGFQRGEELEPLLGIVRRFLAVEPTTLRVDPAVIERSALDRLAHREERLRSYFARPLARWRVRTTVFMPTVSPETDLSRFDGLVVGLEDGAGSCVGIGLLEHDPAEEVLRMVSPVSEGARGLRLGSIRMTTDGRILGRVNLREVLGTD
jgi:polynucleotide 5'-kinase involved in rRNA processing